MDNKNSAVKVKYETLVIIWTALLLSQLMFLVLIFLVKPELFALDFLKPPLGTQPLITLVFAAVAVTVFVLSFVFRNQHMKRAIVDQDAGCGKPDWCLPAP